LPPFVDPNQSALASNELDNLFSREVDMLPCLEILKSKAVLALATAFLVAAPVLANAQMAGTVSFRINHQGVIMGTSGGSGVLVFKGKEYPLRIDGIYAVTIGGSRSTLTGTASNLRAAADIEGSYNAVGVGLAYREHGGRAVRMRSDKGVILKLRGTEVGYDASASYGRVTISPQ
jgi:hypothetical protein